MPVPSFKSEEFFIHVDKEEANIIQIELTPDLLLNFIYTALLGQQQQQNIDAEDN